MERYVKLDAEDGSKTCPWALQRLHTRNGEIKFEEVFSGSQLGPELTREQKFATGSYLCLLQQKS